jgi:hypothetical protein
MASIRLRYFISVAVMRLQKLAHTLSKIGSDRPIFSLLNKHSRALAALGNTRPHSQQTTRF